jgi:hypothetical protein
MPEFDHVGDDLALGVHLNKFEAMVGVECQPGVESFLCAEVPRTLSGWLGMDEHAATNRTKRCLVEIKRPMEVLPGRYLWVES